MAKYTGHTITSDSALGSAVIQKSLRIDQGASDLTGSNYSRTPSSAGNRKTFTISLWVKKCGTPGNIGDGDDQYSMFSTGGGGSGAQNGNLLFYNDDSLYFVSQPQPSANANFVTTRKFRDVASWYHIVVEVDTTQATQSNRVKIYINGVQETSFSTETYPSQNTDLQFNQAERHRIGSNSLGSDLTASYGNFYGYLAEFNFIDGQALDPSSFGFTDPQTSIWMPKRYEGTYGTNGFYLDFTDNTSTTTLGIDKSPNGNDFTPEDVSTTDCVLDTPSNNFCTLNSNDNNMSESSPHFKYSEGNLKVTWSFSGTNFDRSFGNIFIEPHDTNKYYWEATGTQNNEQMVWGVIATDSAMYRQDNRNTGVSKEANVALLRWASYLSAPYLLNIDNSSATEGDALSTTNGNAANNDIFSFVYDAGAGKFYVFFKGVELSGQNYSAGTSLFDTVDTTKTYAVMAYQGDGGSSTKSGNLTMNFGQDSSFAGAKTAQGNKDAKGIGDFYYSVPSGAVALCSKNLPPSVPSIIRPQKHFDVITYTGNNTDDTNITGLEFKPDFVWIKQRSGTNNHLLINSVQRGLTANTFLNSNNNNVDSTDSNLLQSFNKDGFQIGTSSELNQNSETYVAWCWKAGGAAVSNSDGSITSSISANQTAGFSIIAYTGTGSAATIGHGLGKAPKLIWVKNRTTQQDWFVNNGMILNDLGKYYKLNSSGSSNASDTNVFPNTAPTSTVFSVGGDNAVNGSGDNYVAYIWSEIPGFSQFGYWTGSGTSKGPYVHTGFTPRMMIYRKASDENWHILDTQRDPNNPNKLGIDPNLSNAEADDSNLSIDFLGDGFKVRSSHSTANASGTQYFYYVWAGQPGTTPFVTHPNAR